MWTAIAGLLSQLFGAYLLHRSLDVEALSRRGKVVWVQLVCGLVAMSAGALLLVGAIIAALSHV